MRSLLFVPGDAPRKLEKALGSGADALIVDLEDSVAANGKSAAREVSAAFLHEQRKETGGPLLYVRINGLETGQADADLDAVIPAEPAGVVLPKASAGADVMLLDARVTTAEALAGLDDGATRIVAIATETGASLFTMGSYAGASARLEALTWGAEDLSADVGALTSRSSTGQLTDLYRLARALTLAAASAAHVMAVDTVYTDFRDMKGLEADCAEAARDGFTGKLAIHPDQVPVINAAFTPSDEAVREAEEVVAALASDGVSSHGGRMIDRPHMLRAQRVLARARAAGKASPRAG